MSMIWGLYGGTVGSTIAGADAAQAKGAARRAKHSVDDLEARLDRTVMACEAMWTLLRDKLGLTDEQLMDQITALDLSDGKLDGKVRRTAVRCPKCDRTIARRFPNCMYCGQAVVHDPFA